ncbi:MAG: AAA family ATPase, partial [Castellaniella sp.]
MSTQADLNQAEQIEPDGSIVNDHDPDQVSFEEQEQIITTGLRERGWGVVFQKSEKQKKYHSFRINKGDVSLNVSAYIFTNMAWTRRARDEHRIQITRPYDEHADDFDLPKDGNPRCALLGIYRRKDKTLICAWDAMAYQHHAPTTSCYIRTPIMASAMRSGFGQATDSKGRVVCCFAPDMLAYYLENMKALHERGDLDVGSSEVGEASSADTVRETGALDMPTADFLPPSIPELLPRNRICYGAPGTGKSYTIDRDLTRYFPHPGLYQRVTFYPDYTNGAFVGEYKPSPVYRSSSETFFGPDQKTVMHGMEPLIDYRFVPGPFLIMLCKAYLHPQLNFCLIIEEINRAHASAVFGDVFQMLDRNDQGDGRFAVTLSPEAQDYLTSRGIQGSVRLPRNLYIWATMNSADQGVLPLDAAFKRRWALEYM